MNVQCLRQLQYMMFSSLNKINRLNSINIILAECNKGQKKIGVERGPFYILDNMNLLYDDYFVISQNDFNKNNGYKILSDTVKNSINKDFFMLTLGGDHSISSSIVPHYFNLYKEELHLVWIDAHGDLHTHETSKSQNTHGMVLGQILGDTENNVENIEYIPNKDQVTLLGVRDLDDYEIDYCKKNNIITYSTEEIQRLEFPLGFDIKNKLIYVSFDVDVLCPSILDSSGTLVENGLEIENMLYIIENLKMNNRIIGCDIVEFNPYIGDVQKSIDSIEKCIKKIIL